MSREIWKFPLGNPIGSSNAWRIDVPVSANEVHVDVQDGILCVWALVDRKATDVEQREYHMAMTGEPVADAADYIGTVLLGDGLFVVHIFRRFM